MIERRRLEFTVAIEVFKALMPLPAWQFYRGQRQAEFLASTLPNAVLVGPDARPRRVGDEALFGCAVHELAAEVALDAARAFVAAAEARGLLSATEPA